MKQGMGTPKSMLRKFERQLVEGIRSAKAILLPE
jgi:hypothetical protein